MSGDGAAQVEGDFNDYPADLYLGAKDLRGTHMEDHAVGVVQAQRFALFRQATTKIRDMAQAVESVRAFDRTGHAGHALDHLEATFKDVKRVVNQLVEGIEASEDSYVDNLHARRGEHGTKPADAAVEPTPQAPAAPAQTSSPAGASSEGEEPPAGAVVTPNTAAPVTPGPKPGPGVVKVEPFTINITSSPLTDGPAERLALARAAQQRYGI